MSRSAPEDLATRGGVSHAEGVRWSSRCDVVLVQTGARPIRERTSPCPLSSLASGLEGSSRCVVVGLSMVACGVEHVVGCR